MRVLRSTFARRRRLRDVDARGVHLVVEGEALGGRESALLQLEEAPPRHFLDTS